MIDQRTKELIKTELTKNVTRIGSGKKASVEMGISNGTISNILNDKTDLISDDMWRKLGVVMDMRLNEGWQHADTLPYEKLTGNFNDARLHGNCFGIICHPGSGKTHTIDRFCSTYTNVIVVKCVDIMRVRSFYTEILKKLGKKADSYNLYDIQQQIIKIISKLEAPVIIIDELERVKDGSVRSQVIDLYNMLEGCCGIVVLGTSVLKLMEKNGSSNQKVNWNTLFDRIGAKWIELTEPSETDALAIVQANGIPDLNSAYSIINDCKNTENQYSLRRVKRLVHAHLMKKGQPA